MSFDVLHLPHALSVSPESVCDNTTDCCEVEGWSEAASGQVTAVLYRLVAASWRHILRHVDGISRSVCDRNPGVRATSMRYEWQCPRSD